MEIEDFVGLIPVIETNASTLFIALEEELEKYDMGLENCIGFASDGANVMIGSQNSVWSRIKEKSQNCVQLKCICHSLALCVQHAFERMPSNLGFLLKEIPNLNWFSHSSLRRESFTKIFDTINIDKERESGKSHPTPFAKISQTRWLVRRKVLYNTLVNWDELVGYFTIAEIEAKSDCRFKARFIKEMLQDKINRLLFEFVTPVVHEFERVNAMFQTSSAYPHTLMMEIDMLHKSLKRRLYNEDVSDSTKLSGKVAVVTGASAGIGKAIALALGKAGVKCGIGARRLNVLQEVANEIVAAGGKALAVECDVTSRDQVRNLVAKTEEAFGPIDILVNNAGVYYVTFMKSLKEDWWENTIDVNCKGVMNGIGAVLDGMIQRRSGHIINISSDCGRIADPGLAVYCGTKFFVEGMSQVLRKEVSGFGIKVTNIQPGWVDTPGLQSESEPEAIAKFTPINSDLKMLSSDDIAQSVIYALSQPERAMVNEIMIHAMGQDAVEK